MKAMNDQSGNSSLDATQQILAAYGAVITILLDLLVEKNAIGLAEIQQRLDALLKDAPALHPHGARAIQSQLSALRAGLLMRSVPSPGTLAQ